MRLCLYAEASDNSQGAKAQVTVNVTADAATGELKHPSPSSLS